jgi:hypothetical protein
MFVRSPAWVIPRTRQAIGTEKTMITLFFIAGRLTVLDVDSKGSKFNQSLFINYFFPDLKTET